MGSTFGSPFSWNHVTPLTGIWGMGFHGRFRILAAKTYDAYFDLLGQLA